MKFQPLIPLLILMPYLLLAGGAASWQIWQVAKVKRLGKAALWRWIRRAAIVVLPGLLALGPSVMGGSSSPGISNLDIIFAIDVTPSMNAQDYNGTQPRLAGVKSDVLALASKLQGAHIEVVTFDSNASVILPFTTYMTALSTAVSGLETQVSSYSQGSQIDKPIELLKQEFKNSKTANPERFRLLYYFGDGEQTAGAAVKSFADIAPYLNGGAVYGYGTAQGAKMYDTNGYDTSSTSYIMTVDAATGSAVPAISKMNAANLKTIASQLKVSYQDRNQGGPITPAYEASKAKAAVDKSQRIIHYLNLYWLLAVPLAICLFIEWRALLDKLMELRVRRGGKHA